MYSIDNKGNSVVAERFITTLKNKIYKCLPSVSKNFYVDKLDDIVNNYNNTYYRTIKLKPDYVKPSIYTLTLIMKIIGKVLNLKFAIILKYQST